MMSKVGILLLTVLLSYALAEEHKLLRGRESISNINAIPDSAEDISTDDDDDDDNIADIITELTNYKQNQLEERRWVTSRAFFESKHNKARPRKLAVEAAGSPSISSTILQSISALLPDPVRKPPSLRVDDILGEEEEEDSRDLGDVPSNFEEKEQLLPNGGPELLEIRALPLDNTPLKFDLLSGQSSFFTVSSSDEEEPVKIQCTTRADAGGDADLAFYSPKDGTNPTFLCGSASNLSNETCQTVLVPGDDLLVEVVGFLNTTDIELTCAKERVEAIVSGQELAFRLKGDEPAYLYANLEAGTSLFCRVQEPRIGIDTDVDLYMYSADQTLQCSSTGLASNEACGLNSHDYSGPIIVRLQEAMGTEVVEYHEITCYTTATQPLPLDTLIPIPRDAPLQAFEYVSHRGSVQLQCGVTASEGNGTALLMSYNPRANDYYRPDYPCKAQRDEVCHLGGLYPETTLDIQAIFDLDNSLEEDAKLICSEVDIRTALLSPGNSFVHELEPNEAMFFRIESKQAPVHSYCRVKILDADFDGLVEVVRGSLLKRNGRPEIQNSMATSDQDATVANSDFWIVPNTEWVVMVENFRRTTARAPQPVAFQLLCQDQYVRTLTPGQPSLPFALAQEPIFGGAVGFVLPVPRPSSVTCTVQTPQDDSNNQGSVFQGAIDLVGIDEFSAHAQSTELCYGSQQCTAETSGTTRNVLIKITPPPGGNSNNTTQVDHVLCTVDER